VWEVGKGEVGGNHFYQHLPPTRLYFADTELNHIIYPMKIKIVFSTFLLLCSNIIFAHDIVVDGIYYNITSSTEMTVEVTYKGTRSETYNEYSGDVKIPTEIIYEGEIYRVTSISREAFRKCADLSSVIIPNSVTTI
jgi:hypothetical protein